MADLTQMIYSSTPFGYDAADLNGILLDARRCNTRDGVTGALICRHDLFLQYLEGPLATVTATYARISKDDRHVEVTLRHQAASDARLFGDWAMMHDPAHSLIWSAEDVAGGVLEELEPEAYLAAFKAIAATSG